MGHTCPNPNGRYDGVIEGVFAIEVALFKGGRGCGCSEYPRRKEERKTKLNERRRKKKKKTRITYKVS
jgi:hypothetical protein